MRTVQDLREQAARAERLSSGMDHITVERLRLLSQEYRRMAEQMENTVAVVSNAEPGMALPC